MAVIDDIKPYQGTKKSPVAFHNAIAKEIPAITQSSFQLIKSCEQRLHSLLISRLSRRKSCLIDSAVHIFIKKRTQAVLLSGKVGWKQIDRTVSQRTKHAVEHSANIILGVVDDLPGLFIPEHRHTHTTGIWRPLPNTPR